MYVIGAVSKKGVGHTLLQTLENYAQKLGLQKLQLQSSITGKKFYENNGYRNLGKGVHTMQSGRQMECYRMEKQFAR